MTKTGNHKYSNAILAGTAALFFSGAAQAANFSGTGADMLASPLFTFPNGAPSLTGTSAFFGPVGASERRFDLDVAGPGGTSGSYSVVADMTRISCSPGCTNDHDPGFAISDGTYWYWIGALDNNEFQWTVIDGFPGNTFTRVDRGSLDPMVAVGVGQRYELSVTFNYSAADVWGEMSYRNIISGDVYTQIFSFAALTFSGFDATGGVTLSLIGEGNNGERYQINSLNAGGSSDAAVPLPAAGLLLLAGAGALTGVRRRGG